MHSTITATRVPKRQPTGPGIKVCNRSRPRSSDPEIPAIRAHARDTIFGIAEIFAGDFSNSWFAPALQPLGRGWRFADARSPRTSQKALGPN